jgi:hypothetical protein
MADADAYLSALPRYPASTGSGARIVWPTKGSEPVSRRRLIARWLAGKVAIPVASAVAVASAAGWFAAAAVFAWTAASGHAIPWLTGAGAVGEFVIAVADTGAGVVMLVRGTRQADWPARHERRAARRAAKGDRSGVSGWRRPPRLRGVHDAVAGLPRPVRLMLIAGYWTSAAVFGWQLVAAVLDGFGAGDATAQGQELAAAVAMFHLMIWCWLACRTLSRRRAGLSLPPGARPTWR